VQGAIKTNWEKQTMKTKAILTLVLVVVSTAALISNVYACGTEKASKAKAETAETKKLTIVETAINAGSFSTLVEAVKAAGLAETLSGEGPFTVFAPTDKAFAKLPRGTLENLIENPRQLASILTYHVISGEVKAADVVKMKDAKTLNGASFAVNVERDAVKVGNANVVQTDIHCSNGVIHVIDEVLLPN